MPTETLHSIILVKMDFDQSASLDAVLKQLRRYLSRKRQEDGFDLSGPEKPWGEYTVFKGGSHYFNYQQDRQLQCILDSYAKHREGKEFGYIGNLLSSRPTLGRIKGPSDLGTLKEIQQSVQNDSERLVVTIAQLLLEECGIPLSESLPSLINTTPSHRKTISQSLSSKRPSTAHNRRRSCSASSTSRSTSYTNTPLKTSQTSSRKPVKLDELAQYGYSRSSKRQSVSKKCGLSPVYIPPVRSVNPRSQFPTPSLSPTNDVPILYNENSTNTDVITVNKTTQTPITTGTQTDISYLAGKKPPMWREQEEEEEIKVNEVLNEKNKVDDNIVFESTTSLPLPSQIPQLKTESLFEPVTDLSPSHKTEKLVTTTSLVSNTDGKTEDNQFWD